MKERNQSIMERLIAAAEQISDFEELSQKTIARYVKEDPKTLSRRLKKDDNYFDLDKLNTLYTELNQSTNVNHKKLWLAAFNIFLEEIMKASPMKKAEVIDILQKNRSIEFLTAASAAVIFSPSITVVTKHLPDLFASDSKIETLNIVISKDTTARNIEAIEHWAYSFERDHEPIAEMVGGIIEGKFQAYIYSEGYTLMSEIGHELLLDELHHLTDKQPIWSLLRTPEARTIERLRRELSSVLSVEVSTFLADKIAFYESTEPSVEYSAATLWQSLTQEIGDRYGIAAAQTFEAQVEYLLLLDG